MPAKFDFVSPGVQLREVDESQLPPAPEADGIVLIGRARTGPAMKPVKVNNLNDFIDTFGNPIDGVRQEDPWRDGNTAAPNYAAYAAQAYLAAGVGPVKFIRLLGFQKDSNNKAGWYMGSNFNADTDQNAGAYGLFLMPSASSGDQTATLAAILYVSGAAVALSGTVVSSSHFGYESDVVVSASTAIVSNADEAGFSLSVSSSRDGLNTYNINFDESSPKYIRSVLNTDPTKFFNSTNYNKAAATDERYFLGETFDVNINRNLSDRSSGKLYGFILGLDGSENLNMDDFREEVAESKSGWFIGAQPTLKKLFRLVALDSGEEFQKNYYCKVKDIKLATSLNPNATFTLQIVRRGVSINRDVVVEEYAGLSLNPNSANYISKRIGDYNQTWDKTNKKFTFSGKYNNVSNYVRVEVADGINKSDVPFGWAGQKKDAASSQKIDWQDTTNQGAWFDGNNSISLGNVDGNLLDGLHSNFTASLSWPAFGLTTTGTKITSDYGATDTFGLRHVKKSRNVHDYSLADVARKRANFSMHLDEADALSTAAQVFSLDDIKSSSAGATTYFFESGSYDAGTSITFHGGAAGVIDINIKQFAAPFFGGTDGIDIRRANPFSDARITAGGADGYPQFSIDQAIEMVRYQENITCELMSIPGVVNATLGDKLISVAEDRGDCLAIVDVDGIAQETWETESSADTASITTLTSTIQTRVIDSSYAATYFPNIRMRDTLSGNNTVLEAPPSVAAIGAIAKSDSVSHPWFAPAGFNRGGLARLGGSSGPAVIGTSLHLTKADRDTLYDAKVNPIAKFPSTGDTVIFGQKTLQQATSALDRINVRRLMIYLKRQIGVIADTILFDQNVQVTWNRFIARAEAVLSSVQAELGITEYKLVLDETTTTPDLIDRNILYAKIFVRPARSIEFIAIDFIITRTGVEF
ncbi:MAG: phage tail sheath C-terminal domain-containing protein [Candidatus Kariarchaeaceae archaeon]|jgi:hypothetical protein